MTEIDPQKYEAAAEQLTELLAERAIMERRIAETSALTRAGHLATQSDDLLNTEIASICSLRGRRAFLSAALNKKPEEIDDTLMCIPWPQVRSVVPSARAYGDGMRALISQLSIDRPNIVGAAIINLVGADALLHLVGLAGERIFDTSSEGAGGSCANLHECSGAKH